VCGISGRPGSIGNSLEKKLVIMILCASSLITAVLTSFSFYQDYSVEARLLREIVNNVKHGSMESISSALWSYNDSQVTAQIKGIAQIPDVIAIRIYGTADSLLHEYVKKEKKYKNIENYSLKLYSEFKEQKETIGTMKITLTRDMMYQRLRNRILYFFGNQGIKTLLVSFIMLLIFRWFVFRYISKITSFVASYDIQKAVTAPPKLDLGKRKSGKDELDLLSDSINEMVWLLFNYEKENSRIIEHQKAIALNSAKLASLGEMAGGLAHEINNPLSIIQAASQYCVHLLEGQEFTERSAVIESHEKIEECSMRIAGIIENLWRFSGKDSEELPCPVSCASIQENVLMFFSEKSKSLGIAIRTQSISNDIRVLCVINEIEQIMVNLLNNSFYHVKSLETPWIQIDVKPEGDSVLIYVTDSGQGIPEHIQDKILEPFFTTKEVGMGTGLGLSVSAGLAKKNGGILTLDKDFPNTRFCLALPRYSEA